MLNIHHTKLCPLNDIRPKNHTENPLLHNLIFSVFGFGVFHEYERCTHMPVPSIELI